MRRSKPLTFACLSLLLGASLAGAPAVARAEAAPAAVCPTGRSAVRGTCVPSDAAAFVRERVRDALARYELTAAMAEVWIDGERVTEAASGQALTGVPATTDMRFRIGAVSIPYLTTALLQLVDAGKVSLDDKLSRWRPDVPHANEITVGMLASTTSGYADYVRDPKFIADLYKNPFRNWTGPELVNISVSKPLVREPGSGFAYSHANWVLLGDVISRLKGRPLAEVMETDVLEPMGLTATDIPTTAEIPAPVLHGFDNERGVFEDATYWNPSWTLAPGAVMTGTLGDMAKSFTAIGEGELLSAESHREQLAPVSQINPNTSFSLGLALQNGWILQNPSFAGYAGAVAYLPSKKIAIATVATQGPGSTVQNAAVSILADIANHLAPEAALKAE
ncbi:serine hydrolase domain-containing protein [Streptomyces sp. NPDC058623]|uniref:serine hydrolase domain-containing protein n=1 Tax=Streptomyces sp. NPDC058623 TaxID=3346563 RepID=UPI00364D68A9